MAISTISSVGRDEANTTAMNGGGKQQAESKELSAMTATPPKMSLDTDTSSSPDLKDSNSVDNTAEFHGEVDTNNTIPTEEDLQKIESLMVLDKDGKTVPFKDLYNGVNVARRVLVIFIRHFFCGVSVD
jgi:hypothetical protein